MATRRRREPPVGPPPSPRLSRAAQGGDLPDGVDARSLARFVMALSEGHAVHAAAGASREDLQASVDIALRAVALDS